MTPPAPPATATPVTAGTELHGSKLPLTAMTWSSTALTACSCRAARLPSVDNMEAQAILILSGAYLGYLPEQYAAALRPYCSSTDGVIYSCETSEWSYL